MTQAGQFRRRKLQGMPFIIVICAQVDRVAFPPTLRHSHDVDEKSKALFELWSKQFQMTQMGHIHDRFILHVPPLKHGAYRDQASFSCSLGMQSHFWEHLSSRASLIQALRIKPAS